MHAEIPEVESLNRALLERVEAEVRELISELPTKKRDRPRESYNRLSRLLQIAAMTGDAGLPIIEELLKNKDDRIAVSAVNAFSGMPAKQALVKLEGAIRTRPDLSTDAVSWLDPACGSAANSLLIKLMGDSDLNDSGRAVAAAWQPSPTEAEIYAAAAVAIRPDTPDEVRHSFFSNVRLQPDFESVVQPALARLWADEPELRSRFFQTETLWLDVPDIDEARQILVSEADPTPGSRFKALGVLAKLGTADDTAIATEVLTDNNANNYDRAAAAVALGRLGGPEALPLLREVADSHGNGFFGPLIDGCVKGATATNHPEVVPFLVEMAERAQRSSGNFGMIVKDSATQGLESIAKGTTGAAPVVIREAVAALGSNLQRRTSSTYTKQVSIEALGRSGSTEAIEPLLEALRSEPDIVLSAAKALIELTKSPNLQLRNNDAHLLVAGLNYALFQDGSVNESIGLAATEALANVGTKSAMAGLDRAAFQHRFQSVRRAAVLGLAINEQQSAIPQLLATATQTLAGADTNKSAADLSDAVLALAAVRAITNDQVADAPCHLRNEDRLGWDIFRRAAQGTPLRAEVIVAHRMTLSIGDRSPAITLD